MKRQPGQFVGSASRCRKLRVALVGATLSDSRSGLSVTLRS